MWIPHVLHMLTHFIFPKPWKHRYVHPCGTHFIFPKPQFYEIFSILITICSAWVHILCLTIQLWEVQIRFFMTVNYQFRMWSRSAKVEVWKSLQENMWRFSIRFICKRMKFWKSSFLYWKFLISILVHLHHRFTFWQHILHSNYDTNLQSFHLPLTLIA